MTADFSIISVFTSPRLGYKGNTAAVVILDGETETEALRDLASDLNQPATSFLWPGRDAQHWHVRWFAPDGEIQLCGHGAMAAVCHLAGKVAKPELYLEYANGTIEGCGLAENRASITLDAIPTTGRCEVPPLLSEALGVEVLELHATDNKYIALLKDHDAVRRMQPDFHKLRKLKTFGYSVTAQGDGYDFVSRTLVPHVRQLEDHATGSSHAALVPFWSDRLGLNKMSAAQLSPRGGKFECEREGAKVTLTGEYQVIGEGNVKVG